MNVLVKTGLLIAIALASMPSWSQPSRAEEPDAVIKRSLKAQTTTTIKLPAIDYTQDTRVPIPSFTAKEGDSMEKLPAFFAGAMNAKLTPDSFKEEMTFKDAPGFARLPIKELKKIAFFDISKVPNPIEGKTLADLMPEIETTKLSELGLNKAEFSKIDFTKAIGDMPITIADIGGANIGMDKIVDINAARDPSAKLIKVDRVYTAEKKGAKITSGSNREPIQKCGDKCDLAEFQSATVKDNTNGIQAVISGPSTPNLLGGVGFFGQMFSDAAGGDPGGYKVFSPDSDFLYTFHNANAKIGTVTGWLNSRVCWDVWGFGRQCTNHFIRFPIAQMSEKGNTMIPFPLIVNAPALKTPTPLAAADDNRVIPEPRKAIVDTATAAVPANLDKATNTADIFGANVKNSESLLYGTTSK